MKEKLTKERFMQLWQWSDAPHPESVWDAIESDREAVREETRDEMRNSVDPSGNALNEAGWAFIGAWKESGFGDMGGDIWNNCKQKLLKPSI